MYLDTSVYLKMLVAEPDSAFYGRMLDGRREVVSSTLLSLEAVAALHQRLKAKDIRRAHFQRALAEHEDKVATGGIELLALSQSVMDEAEVIFRSLGRGALVRTLDALHLGTCRFHEAYPLLTADARMQTAAKRLEIPLAVPA